MSDQEAIGSGLATAVPAIRRRAPSMARLGIGALLLCVAVLVAALAVDDVRTHRQAAQEARRAADLSRRLGAATTTIGRLDGQLADLRTENAGLQDEARNP